MPRRMSFDVYDASSPITKGVDLAAESIGAKLLILINRIRHIGGRVVLKYQLAASLVLLFQGFHAWIVALFQPLAWCFEGPGHDFEVFPVESRVFLPQLVGLSGNRRLVPNYKHDGRPVFCHLEVESQNPDSCDVQIVRNKVLYSSSPDQ
jgi:hypothetical protein